MARLIHVNGPPGIGKSTLARRYAADHPGTLCCDVDVLRTMIGGWREDFLGAGARIRPAALALIGAYLERDGDVVLPQLITRDVELARFEAVADRHGARYAHVVLDDDPDAVVGRFDRRAGEDPWHREVSAVVAEQGGARVVTDHHSRLLDLVSRRTDIHVVATREGRPDAAYDGLLAAISGDG